MTARLADGAVLAGIIVVLMGLGASLAVLLVQLGLAAPGASVLGGLAAATLGTVLLAVGAGALAAPVGIGLALWARWLAPPPLRRPAGLLLSVLGDIPPACLAVALLAVPVSGLVGSWVLLVIGVALVAVPTVAGRALDAVDRVPEEQILQAIALGARPGEAVAAVVLPRAGPGLRRSALAGVSRALGETVLVVVLLAGLPGEVLTRSVVLGTLAPLGPDGALAPVAALILVVLGVATWLTSLVLGRPR